MLVEGGEIVQKLLYTSWVRNNFSQFIDSVVNVKPQAVKRNHDVFWCISQKMMEELLAGYTFILKYEQEDGSFCGYLIPIIDIICFGETYGEMVEDAVTKLEAYAHDYYRHFERNFHVPNGRNHLPYILNILNQEDCTGIKKLINEGK